MANQEESQLAQSKKSLERMQSFDVATLPRVDVLGTAINFEDAIEPANRLIDIYKQLPIEVLEQLPDKFLQKIISQADNDFNILNSILTFEPGSPKTERDSRINSIKNAYDPAFSQLYQLISYSVRKSTDFSRLERDARSLIQSTTDRTNELQQELEKRNKEADSILESIRKVAAEQGVSQQAIYFKNEADNHEQQSRKWLIATICLTICLALYAIATLTFHKIPLLTPTNAYETTQLAVSKILIFITIFFVLMLASRNYLAHRHNLVVNRHRQNALVTYQAIVKAAGEEANRDVILAKAADCIFTAQPTAFSKMDGIDSKNLSLINVAPSGIKTAITS